MLASSDRLWPIDILFSLNLPDETAPGRRMDSECLFVQALDNVYAGKYGARNNGPPPISGTM